MPIWPSLEAFQVAPAGAQKKLFLMTTPEGAEERAWFQGEGIVFTKRCDEIQVTCTTTGDCPEIEWIRIDGGSFEMGSNNHSREQPIHTVNVPSFEIMKTEVTVAQYQACVDAGECTEPDTGGYEGHCNWGRSGRENYPINCVDWLQARAFSKWVGGDLPSEAQWEYAARSQGQNIIYPWGNAFPERLSR